MTGNTRPLFEGALILHVDGTITALAPDYCDAVEEDTGEEKGINWYISGNAINQAIGCDVFEIVNLDNYNIGRYIDGGTAMALMHGLRNHVLIMDENGKNKNLPVNPIATQLAGGADIIVGDVILCPTRLRPIE